MKGNDRERQAVRMELKYCEGCGGLWVRECGSGDNYCCQCESRVTELPRFRRGPKLPVGKCPMVSDYDLEACGVDVAACEAVGGVA